jgi:predicted Zn-dependent protease
MRAGDSAIAGNGRSNRRLRSAITVGLTALLLAGCNALMAPDGGPTAAVFSDGVSRSGTERIDTEEHSRIVAAYGGVYHDDKLVQALVPTVSRIVAASDRPDQSYRITILNAPAVNACALPGGYLYVTRGLLALANESSEVAAVLAHEMAHVTANHAIERQNKARNALIVSRVVTDVLNHDDGGRLALASSQRSLASFSRQQELEADAMGVKTIGRAGYDPFAATRFLESMERFAVYRASLIMQDNRPDFLSSHPSTPERVDFAAQAARQFGAPGIGDIDRDRYLDGIDGMIFGDDPSQGFVRERSFVHPALGVGFTVPEGFVIDNTNDAVLATGADGTALRFDAVALASGTELGDYLKSGWVNGLDDSSVRSFSVNRLQAASATAEAKGWSFEIAVIRVGNSATYRFIFANELPTPEFKQAAQATVDSFRTLSDSEISGLKPLTIKVVKAGIADSEATMVRKMHGVDRPRELFRAINDLEPGRIKPGTKVKIVTDR